MSTRYGKPNTSAHVLSTWPRLFPDHPSRDPQLAHHVFPGGYTLYAVTDDGGVICPTCVAENLYVIRESIPGDGWHLQAITTTECDDPEDPTVCDNCGKDVDR